ncbi:MAG: hypothetical protein AAB545_02075 [Patescibacteria group bacterium]
MRHVGAPKKHRLKQFNGNESGTKTAFRFFLFFYTNLISTALAVLDGTGKLHAKK